jgi:cation diffusion facilitator family transporter
MIKSACGEISAMVPSIPTLSALEHGHQARERNGERRVTIVLICTVAVMVLELVVGWVSGSLALTADGWHMGTHAAALGLSTLAYWFARTRANSPMYSFGTGKVDSLAGYTSSLLLFVAAIWMGYESFERLLNPREVHFSEAIVVATVGLVFNLGSAWFLGLDQHDHHGRDVIGHHHHHGQEKHACTGGHASRDGGNSAPSKVHAHPSSAAKRDINLEAAYLHVMADALTSVLAIASLVAGQYLDWYWMDAAVAVVAALLIGKWAAALVVRSSACLLDVSPCLQTQRRLREVLEAQHCVRVLDFHLWEIAPGRLSCIAVIATPLARPTAYFRELLLATAELAHVTVEVHVDLEMALTDASPRTANPASSAG